MMRQEKTIKYKPIKMNRVEKQFKKTKKTCKKRNTS